MVEIGEEENMVDPDATNVLGSARGVPNEMDC